MFTIFYDSFITDVIVDVCISKWHHCVVLLACHPTSITSKTEQQIFMSKRQSKYCLINMGGIDQPKNYIEKTLFNNHNFHMHIV